MAVRIKSTVAIACFFSSSVKPNLSAWSARLLSCLFSLTSKLVPFKNSFSKGNTDRMGFAAAVNFPTWQSSFAAYD